MEPLPLFGLQTTLSFLVYVMLAAWYVAPRLTALPLEAALMPLVWVHAFRHVGLTILAPGAADPGIPIALPTMIAYGDLASGMLALIALFALRWKLAGAIALVWVFNVVGVADLASATVQGIRHQVFTYPLGVNWLIVTFYVPALWVSSFMIFHRLLKPRVAATRGV